MLNISILNSGNVSGSSGGGGGAVNSVFGRTDVVVAENRPTNLALMYCIKY